VIGAGSVARLHLREVGERPGVAVVAIADPADPSQWRADHARAMRFRDPATMLARVRPQLVSICTPTAFHCELTLLALRAGAHVICEKPMATTVAQAQDMERTRAAAGRLGAVNFTYRDSPPLRYARELVGKGAIGRVTRVAGSYLQSFLAADTSGWTWRRDVELAGFGALGDLGVHVIDAVRFVSGLEFERVAGAIPVSSETRRDANGTERPVTTDSAAAFVAELSAGAVGTFEVSQVAAGYGDAFRLELSGERGTVTVDSERPGAIGLIAGPDLPREPVWSTDIPIRELPAGRREPPTPRSLGAVVEALRGRAVEFASFGDGLAAQRVLGALRESARRGRWVAVR
jgi:predicted dehydrogenase